MRIWSQPRASMFLVILISLSLISATDLLAQGGVITGRLTISGSEAPAVGARVEAISGGRAVGAAESNENGVYRIGGLPPGTYSVSVTPIGYMVRRIGSVTLDESAEARLDAVIAPVELAAIEVESASKRVEDVSRTPSTVIRLGEEEIDRRVAVSPVEYLKSAPGVDLIEHGIQSANVSARGFNNIFSGAMHVLKDHRIASVPSLRVNLLHFIPSTSADLESIEVVLGPGSALYGPNTANGVLHLLTASPLDAPGTSVSFAAGERSVRIGEFRSAHRVSDRFGFKVSGQLVRGDEWRFTDPVEQAARDSALSAGDLGTRIGLRDFDIERGSVDIRADWRPGDETNLMFSAGRTFAGSGIELTGVGAAQAVDWTYSYAQLRANHRRLFAQAYINTSDAGDTYLLRDGSGIIDRSKLVVVQAQHGFGMRGGHDLQYGADFLRTVPETDGSINGVNEDSDDITEVGAYVLGRARLSSRLDLVAAGRVDKHSELPDPVFSPRVALVLSPARDQSVRLSYNRAFSTPTALNLFLDIGGGPVPDPRLAALGYGIRAQAPGREGFRFRVGGPTSLHIRSPFNPAGGRALLEANSAALLQLAVGALQAGGHIDAATAELLRSLQPTDEQVGVVLIDMLDPSAAPVAQEDVALRDIPGIRESINNTFEVGYTGVLGGRVLIAADVWHSRITNFTSPLSPQNAYLALLNGPKLGAFLFEKLVEAGVPAAQAQAQAGALAEGIASLPLGIVTSPDMQARGAELLATFRNFGSVRLSGADIAVKAQLDEHWTLGLTGSIVSDDHFLSEGQLIALNAPELKGSVSVGYASGGASAEARMRHTSGFPASSAVYFGTSCALGEAGSGACVDSATLFDLAMGYTLPSIPGARLQLTVQNLLDTGYRSFVGVPEMGRLALLRVTYVWR